MVARSSVARFFAAGRSRASFGWRAIGGTLSRPAGTCRGAGERDGRPAVRTSKGEAGRLWSRAGRSWREIGRRLGRQIFFGDVFGRSAELAYYFLFAVFPLLFFLTTALGYLAGA